MGETNTRRRSLTASALPQPPPAEVIFRWQEDLRAGRDPGLLPILSNGRVMTREAARFYFGYDCLDC